MSRRSRRFALVALVAASVGAHAAELPSRAAKPKADDKARACEIAGERGIALPNGGCVKISGYVSAGVAAGNTKH
jgi:hypothetical protein